MKRLQIKSVLVVMAMMLMLPGRVLAQDDVKKVIIHKQLTTETGDSVSATVAEQLGYDPSQKVIVGNDTVDIIIPSKNYGRYDRGLFSHLFVPKGQFAFGLEASYGSVGGEDLQMLNYISDFDFDATSYSFKPFVCYFFKHNQALGIRFGFNRTQLDLNSFALDFDEDINFNIHDVNYDSKSYSWALFHRNYIGFDNGRRFALFNETSLKYSGGSGEFSRLYNDAPKVTRSTSSELRLDFSPGLCVFIQEKVSFNLSFGIFGWYLKREKQVTDGVDEGTRSASGASFKFNLFNMNMGVAVFI